MASFVSEWLLSFPNGLFRFRMASFASEWLQFHLESLKTVRMRDKNKIQRFKFDKKLRLRKSVEFERVFASKHYAADDTLVVNAQLNGSEDSRLGLSIGRKVGNAVVRNQWKRIIREVFRCNRSTLPTGLDIVVRPRKGADPEISRVERSLLGLVRRVNRSLRR